MHEAIEALKARPVQEQLDALYFILGPVIQKSGLCQARLKKVHKDLPEAKKAKTKKEDNK